MTQKTCITPEGSFRYGIHKPHYEVHNLREKTTLSPLGTLADGTPIDNRANFPDTNVSVEQGEWVFEIPNPLPFRGTTYITKSWADAKAAAPETIHLPKSPDVSMTAVMKQWHPAEKGEGTIEAMFLSLPQPVLLALAVSSTDATDLCLLAKMACSISFDQDGHPDGILYQLDDRGRARAQITNHHLFETVVNNPNLPDTFRNALVLKPGVQGASEIVGDFSNGQSHVFEYLRQNSYIPWGHYAANMANDAIRYSIAELSSQDIRGLRHLYYQRTFTRMAKELDLPLPKARQQVTETALEELRLQITAKMQGGETGHELKFNSTLWGWNYGFSCAANTYRLHASHQMIHQQFALLPTEVTAQHSNKNSTSQMNGTISSYSCGDLVADFIKNYYESNNSNFFDDYLKAIRHNQRMDNRPDLPAQLMVFEDENVILFVPKAQTSQWELQLMTLDEIGNILEANTKVRNSLDNALLIAMQILTGLGATMITTIEFPKRFSAKDKNQRLLYSFLPKLPESPGAFSEAQLRWINGHYPEDFARACREKIKRED